MLQELLKHKALGNKQEIGFVLFHALASQKWQNLNEVKIFAQSNIYSIGHSFDGIVSVLGFTDYIEHHDGRIRINSKTLDPSQFGSWEAYFDTPHFLQRLLVALGKEGSLSRLFNATNTRFDHQLKQFYVKSHLIPIDLFPVRNLLIALEVLSYDSLAEGFLYITSGFTDIFREIIVENVDELKPKKQITSVELNRILLAQAQAGLVAELYALGYEQRRLEGHDNSHLIQRISEINVNAGYDIISFEDLDSFFNDRYIEVKSYTEDVSFYWSRNEIEVASKLGESYYLYLIDRSKTTDDTYVPRIIRNPIKRIFEGELWKREVENWFISLDGD